LKSAAWARPYVSGLARMRVMRDETFGHVQLAEGHVGASVLPLPWPLGLGEATVALAALTFPLALVGELWQQREVLSGKGGHYLRKEKADVEQIRYYDLWRFICVTCVVITHRWEGYHEKNFFAVGQWVLQFLMLISGTCFGKSSSPLWRYCRRLVMIWAVGTLLNWTALVATQGDWRNNPERVSYQMLFALQILTSAIMITPLKWQVHFGTPQLRENQDISGRSRRSYEVMAMLWYLAIICHAGILRLGHPCWEATQLAEAGHERYAIELLESAFILLVASLAHAWLPEEARGWIGWAMFLLLEGSRVLHAEPRPGSELHLNDLYMWATFIHVVPLKYDQEIGRGMAQLWPVWAVGCALLSGLPGSEPPFPALQPSQEVLQRARFYAVESILVLAFVTIPTAGPNWTMTIPAWTGPGLRWLNSLSLVAFCTHKAIFDLLA